MSTNVSKEFIVPVFRVYIIHDCGTNNYNATLYTLKITCKNTTWRYFSVLKFPISAIAFLYPPVLLIRLVLMWWWLWNFSEAMLTGEKRKKNPSQCHFLYHKPHVCSGKKQGRPRWEVGDWPPETRIHSVVNKKTDLDACRTENIKS
jgi:hypothetical protein